MSNPAADGTIDAPALAPVTMSIDGLHCASCVARVERALDAVPGVLGSEVSLLTGTARVALAEPVAAETLTGAVTDAGFGAELTSKATPAAPADDGVPALVRDTSLAAALTLPLVVIAMGGHVSPAFGAWMTGLAGTFGVNVVQLVLATLVLAFPGRRFFASGFPQLRRGTPEMNALVALGASTAWVYSVLVTLLPFLFPPDARVVYFEAAAVIVTLILLGRTLEARAKGQTGAAIAALMDLSPPTAILLTGDTQAEVAQSDLRSGDLVMVKPGAAVPADGTVVEGTSSLDEAMLTGEPAPVAKRPGDPVTGGTINGKGVLTVRVTAAGENTVLARIVRMVEDAQGGKLPVQALIDRISFRFVPVVIAIAVAAALTWLVLGPEPRLTYALIAGASVLLIACPCAIGLAAPVSVTVGIGRGARQGLLFRKGAVFEDLAKVDIIAFDKTGTLTLGKPEVVDGWTLGDTDQDVFARQVAALEARSEHPIAHALASVPGPYPTVRALEVHPGLGLSGIVGGARLTVGSARLMEQIGADLSEFRAVTAHWEQAGWTPVIVARDRRAIGAFAVADPVKPEAEAALAALRQRGLDLAMISGDTPGTAQAVADTLSIGRVHAGASPADKRDVIARWQAEGRKVAFVGDGINDAPALAQADVGIAVNSGTDAAIEGASLVLTRNDLGRLATAHDLADAVVRNIRQNLAWAFAYNVALIPVAAGALWPVFGLMLSPMLAAGAMTLSSLFVLANALRLQHRPLGAR